MRKNLYFC